MTIYWSKLTDSTNLDAMREKGSAEDRTVWAAEFQSAGRGQRGNRWESEEGKNLMFSILFKPKDFPATNQFHISMAVASGVADYLASKGIKASVKWPNDIYSGDRKICGMLIENTLSGDRLAACIAGIGLNVNQRIFPADLPNPTSLVLELERSGCTTASAPDIHTELPSLLQSIFSRYESVTEPEGRKKLSEHYMSIMYRLGEKHLFEETEYFKDRNAPGPRRFEGIIRGIEEDTSRLIVEHPDGNTVRYFFKEIKFII